MLKAVTPEGFDSLRGDEAGLRPAPTLRDGAQDESGCSAIHGVEHPNAKRIPAPRSFAKSLRASRTTDERKKEHRQDCLCYRGDGKLETSRTLGSGEAREYAIEWQGDGTILPRDDEDYRRHGVWPAGVYISSAVRDRVWRGGGAAVCLLERFAGNSCAAGLPAECSHRTVCDDGQSIGTFALQRRILLTYGQIPKVLKDAILTTEDQHFEEHWGVDIPRVLQAAWHDIAKHRLAEGASTLTMQLAGGLFLNRSDRSARRKIEETIAGDPDRAALHQRTNFHDVLQPDLSGFGELWLRGSIGILFQ